MLGNGKNTERPHTHAEINEYRRKALIEGTIKSLSEHGVGGTTVRSICAEAGSSRGLIGHYFESKEHLLEAAFRHLYTTVANHVVKAQKKAGEDPHAKLLALPQSVFSSAVFTPLIRNAFLTFWHEIRFNPLVREANREVYGEYLHRTELLFSQASKERGLEINPKQAAIGLITMIDGLWLSLSIYDRLTSRESAVATCQQFIDLQLGAGPGERADGMAEQDRDKA